MKFIFLLVFFSGIFLLVFFYIKFFLVFNALTDYLFEIDDKDTLRKIGRLNALDQRLLASVPFLQAHKVLREKYKETNNEKYLEFDKKCMCFTKLIIFIISFLFIFYVVYKIMGAQND